MSTSPKRGRVTPKQSHRYTPPQPKSGGGSSAVIPILMFACFALGCAVIILNYFDGAPLLPGDTSNGNLLAGLGLITAGFIFATKWR